jgi:GNAT superfamily N-acetyltransferase
MNGGSVREISSGKSEIARAILEDLPEWFGIAAGREDYIRAAATLPMLGFVAGDEVLGFVSLKRQTEVATEAFVLGVKRSHHRQGIGRRLFAAAEARLREEGILYFTVKTVAADRPNEAYAATRRFYAAMGVAPLEVFPTLWGPDNPCLLMVKRITA